MLAEIKISIIYAMNIFDGLGCPYSRIFGGGSLLYKKVYDSLRNYNRILLLADRSVFSKMRRLLVHLVMTIVKDNRFIRQIIGIGRYFIITLNQWRQLVIRFPSLKLSCIRS